MEIFMHSIVYHLQYNDQLLIIMKILDDIALRPLLYDDAIDIYDAIDSQREYLRRWLPFVDSTKSLQFTQEFVSYSLNIDECTFTIRKNDQFIGLIGFKASDKENRKTEIGYWLMQEYQGRGIMSCAVKRLCQYAFEELAMNRIQIKCAVGNTPSSNIPKRLGFKFEGIEREGELFTNGSFANIEVYSLLKKEYSAHRFT